jgi:hypothetical protein
MQFKADLRKKKIGITKLPALALNGKLLCEGTYSEEEEIEELVREILN